MLAPSEALPHIKCNVCNKYLSVFPIFICQDSKVTICGRCSDILTVSGNYIRDTAYEGLAQFMKFPCIYAHEGCVEQLTPNDIPEHEKQCPHRIISCAMDCVWQGTAHEVLSHVEEIHQNSILRDGEFEMDTLHSYEVFNFVVHDDEIFTMKRKYSENDDVLQCSLFCYKSLEQVTKYFYEITVYNGTRSLSVKFPLKSADTFQEENVTEIDVTALKKRLDDPSIMIGYVKILTTEDKKPAVVAAKPNPEINSEMLSELECPVCLEYIIPPIYQCVTGHSICAECKLKITECPSCKKDIKDTQNFTLEKMAFLLNYPCKYSEYGCDFVAKPGKIKQHQKYCSLGPKFCPLADCVGCKWSGAAKDTYSHIVQKHHDNLLEIDNIYVFLNDGYFEGSDSQCYVKKFSNVMFKLRYKYSHNKFCWAVQLIGPPDEAKNYKFEIDLVDHSGNNQKLFIRSLCSPLSEENETFNQGGEFVYVKLKQIQSFITDQLTYTIRITQ